MRLYANQFQAHIDKALAKCYLLVGDEPLQKQEAFDAILQKARKQGFSERERHLVDAKFQWYDLQNASANLSLFAEKRILDLYMPTGKAGQKGSAFLTDFVRNLPDDVLLIIRCDEWTMANDKTKWVKTVIDEGIFMRVYQPDIKELPQWMANRCRRLKLNIDQDAIGLLAYRLEGNLLAAAQELDKLKMRFGEQRLDIQTLAGLVADNARFDVFRLTDALLAGDSSRAIRVTRSLQQNDTSPVVVHWALENLTRQLAELAFIREKQHNISKADFQRLRIWPKQQAVIQRVLNRLKLSDIEQLLQRLSDIDMAIKGRRQDNPWQAIEHWLMLFNQSQLLTA
ncbi:MAG: DNA polymerase III subunit delta [Proteobacteria bacterium]|nr:MAG: DNA polymerase III subunit delta [Pseudomonadota bacterium]